MTHLKNNEAPAIDRGCVADASHVSLMPHAVELHHIVT
jgi:hypothetical protein